MWWWRSKFLCPFLIGRIKFCMISKNGFPECTRFVSFSSPKQALQVFPLKIFLIWKEVCSIHLSESSKASDVKENSYFLARNPFSLLWLFAEPTKICLHSLNQSNSFLPIRLLFWLCLQAIISRSHENRSTPKFWSFWPILCFRFTLPPVITALMDVNARQANFTSKPCLELSTCEAPWQ